MPDIAIRFTAAELEGDFDLLAADVATGDALKTAILISLFTDPGWWANLYEDEPLGCRLIELRRSKHGGEVPLRARDYCTQALAWMVRDRVVAAVDVSAAWAGGALEIGIVVTQAAGVARYAFAWKEV